MRIGNEDWGLEIKVAKSQFYESIDFLLIKLIIFTTFSIFHFPFLVNKNFKKYEELKY